MTVSSVYLLLSNAELVRDTRDERNKLLCASDSHTNVPSLVISRMLEYPTQV